jgi:glyoxylase-like metal-dependent hydrolase (beta-lactamase superfamily II)
MGRLFTCGLALLIALAVPILAGAQNLRVLQVQPGFYMIGGAGANVAVQTGPDGVVVVDSGSAAMASAVVAEIKKLSSEPIRYIINTSADADHAGGNEVLAKAGQSLFVAGNGGPGGGAAAEGISNGGGASIIATESVYTIMSEQSDGRSRFPTVAWPTETYSRGQKALYLNNEGIQVLYQPAAHTEGDSIVFFRRSDVVVTGEIFDITRFPVIDVEHGGSIQGEIAALNRLIEVAIPSIPLPWKEGGTQIIPAHGRVCEQAEVVEYRDMLTIIRDRVQDMIKKSMTLDQIQSASPAQGYERRFGADTGPWTTRNFIAAVYKSLTGKK